MRHSPRKRFGQNFLEDRRIIDQIVQAFNPHSEDNVLEIGPGLGALTIPLLKRVNTIKAVEIDRDLHSYLAHHPETQAKLQLISADALTLDYSRFGQNLRLIGNLPYNISTPLLIHLVAFIPFIADMVFMLQKEVVDRIAAAPGCKAYGRLSVVLQYYCAIEPLFTVPSTAFDPQPKVESAVVRLTPYKEIPYESVSFKQLEYIVAKAFAMRRKTLNNNLKGLFSVEQLAQMGLDGSKRAEQLSIADYVQLAQHISI